MKKVTSSELKAIQVDILRSVHDFCQKNGLNYSLAYGTLLGAVRHKGFIPWDDDIDIMMPRSDYENLVKTYTNPRFVIINYKNSPGYELPYAKVYDRNTIIHEKLNMNVSYGVNIDIFPVDIAPDEESEIDEFFKKKNRLTMLHKSKLLKICKQWRPSMNAILFCAQIVLSPFRLRSFTTRIDKMCQKYASCDTNKWIICATVDSKRSWVFDKEMFTRYTKCEFEGEMYNAVGDPDKLLTIIYGDYMRLPPEDKRVSHHTFTAYWK